MKLVDSITFLHRLFQGLETVPFWEYWTSPKIVAMALTTKTIHGWVMFNGDI
jgi:hypothetical protein